MSRDVVVLSAVRSPIGAFGGSLADFDSSELAGIVMKEAIARSNVDPQQINYVTVGTTMATDSSFAYVSRVASIQAGLSMESVAMQVSRLCASGLQGIVTTAQNLMLALWAGSRYSRPSAGDSSAWTSPDGTRGC